MSVICHQLVDRTGGAYSDSRQQKKEPETIEFKAGEKVFAIERTETSKHGIPP